MCNWIWQWNTLYYYTATTVNQKKNACMGKIQFLSWFHQKNCTMSSNTIHYLATQHELIKYVFKEIYTTLYLNSNMIFVIEMKCVFM